MKVLHVGPHSVHVTRFINAFQKEGIDHFLLTEEPDTEVQVVDQFVLNVHTLNPLKFIGFFAIVKRILTLVQPDVIHVHQVNRLAFIVTKVAAQVGIPVITTAWGSDVLVMPKKNKLYHFMVRKTIERSKFITADAREMVEAMQKIVLNSTNYHLIQYGIEPVAAQKKEKIIYSNRLHKKLYRIDAIVAYFSSFHASHPDWKLRIGGSGAETELLKQQVADLKLHDHVVFLGWLDESKNREEYAKASIYVSLPWSDGTSVSLLEAMSAGCIPVVSDLLSNKEWIDQGENGIIETIDQNPFEQALLLDSDSVAKRNQLLIAEKATRTASITKFEAIYQQAIYGK